MTRRTEPPRRSTDPRVPFPSAKPTAGQRFVADRLVLFIEAPGDPDDDFDVPYRDFSEA